MARRGSAVLLVTHNVLEAERVVDRLAIVDQGQVKGIGTPASLKEDEGGAMHLELILEPSKPEPTLPDYLQNPVTVNRRIVARVRPTDIATAIEWARSLKENDAIEEFSLGPATLEDTYVHLVQNPDELEQPGEVS